MSVPNDMQYAGAACMSDSGHVVDEPPPDSAPPEMRLDKQGVQLCIAVRARHDGARGASRSPSLASDARHCNASKLERSAGPATPIAISGISTCLSGSRRAVA